MQILVGHAAAVTKWAAQKIDGLYQPTHAFGLLDKSGALRGCFLLNEITRSTADVILYSEETPGAGIARQVFKIPFVLLGYERLQAIIQRSNTVSRKQTPRWGFKYDGTARHFFANGEDAIRFVMLKEECPWLRTRKTHGTAQQTEAAYAD